MNKFKLYSLEIITEYIPTTFSISVKLQKIFLNLKIICYMYFKLILIKQSGWLILNVGSIINISDKILLMNLKK